MSQNWHLVRPSAIVPLDANQRRARLNGDGMGVGGADLATCWLFGRFCSCLLPGHEAAVSLGRTANLTPLQEQNRAAYLLLGHALDWRCRSLWERVFDERIWHDDISHRPPQSARTDGCRIAGRRAGK